MTASFFFRHQDQNCIISYFESTIFASFSRKKFCQHYYACYFRDYHVHSNYRLSGFSTTHTFTTDPYLNNKLKIRSFVVNAIFRVKCYLNYRPQESRYRLHCKYPTCEKRNKIMFNENKLPHESHLNYSRTLEGPRITDSETLIYRLIN